MSVLFTTVDIGDIVLSNMLLLSLWPGYDLSTSAAASFTRFNLAEYLRSQVCPFRFLYEMHCFFGCRLSWLVQFLFLGRLPNFGSRPNTMGGKFPSVCPSVCPSVHKKFLRFR